MKPQRSLCMPEPYVAILHQEVAEDAPPDERDTLVQVQSVDRALCALGYHTERLRLGLDLAPVIDRLRTREPVLIFNLVESLAGDQPLASIASVLLEALDIPFTGNGSHGLRLTGDKLRCKCMLRDAGLPTPEWRVPADLSGDRAAPSGRWILKPVLEDASARLSGESVLVDGARLADALSAIRHRLGGRWFAERYIDGRELSVALLQGERGPQVLPVAEIRFLDFPPGRPRILDYAAKWEPESFAYKHTQRCFDFDPADAPLLERLQEMSLACWGLFGLAGYARVDVRVDADGVAWILEVNANPCLAPDAGFMAAAHQACLGFDEVVGRLVRAALDASGRAPAGASPARRGSLADLHVPK
jgi:D-alanine-D-alanine ligase